MTNLFKAATAVKEENLIKTVHIVERKIICNQCKASYLSSDFKVKLYAYNKERVLCICPECAARFTIKKTLIFTPEFLAAVAEKYRHIREQEMSTEKRAAKEAEKEAKKQEREEERARVRRRAEEDARILEEEAAREREERMAKMSPDMRLRYEARIENLKRAAELRRAKKLIPVDTDYI
jgi:acyl-CoA thioesterase